MKVITVKMEKEMLEWVDFFASMYKLSRSDVIREAVERYIKEELAKMKDEKLPSVRMEKIWL